MGHHLIEITGVGRNRSEALGRAVDDYILEEGRRNSFDSLKKATFIKLVPPDKTVERKQGRWTVMSSEPDLTAPQSEWLEEWEFEVDFHA